MRLFENYQTDTMSKKPKKRSLYKQNIFCSSELVWIGVDFTLVEKQIIIEIDVNKTITAKRNKKGE